MQQWFSAFKVTTRLYLAFGALIALLAGSLGAVWVQQRNQETAVQRLLEQDLRKLRLIDRWVALSESTALRILAVNSTPDAAVGALFGPEIGPRVKEIGELYKEVDTLSTTPRERAEMDALVPKRERLLATLARLTELRRSGDADGAAALFKAEFAPAVSVYLAHLKHYGDLQGELTREAAEAARADSRRHATALGGAMIVGVLLAAAGVSYLLRRLQRAFAQAVDLAQCVAGGDLTVRSHIEGSDELAVLMRALSGMAGSLEVLVHDVRQGTASIAVASSEIAQGNADLSVRTEHQSSSLQQAASAMEQMTSTVAQTSDHARQADAMAREASTVAVSGGQAVQQVVATMGQIQAASRRIAEIIGVIDGIAFQTNILALNAAVEAARAGEQGRGFAVVAGEVRTLARRSAEAAREIRTLISDSNEKVDAGHVQVGLAGQRMDEIVDAVRRVSLLIAEISRASAEQNGGIAEVGRSVSEIEQATQQNAALVEQAAAAADSMKTQAQRLEEAVSVFRVGAPA